MSKTMIISALAAAAAMTGIGLPQYEQHQRDQAAEQARKIETKQNDALWHCAREAVVQFGDGQLQPADPDAIYETHLAKSLDPNRAGVIYGNEAEADINVKQNGWIEFAYTRNGTFDLPKYETVIVTAGYLSYPRRPESLIVYPSSEAAPDMQVIGNRVFAQINSCVRRTLLTAHS